MRKPDDRACVCNGEVYAITRVVNELWDLSSLVYDEKTGEFSILPHHRQKVDWTEFGMWVEFANNKNIYGSNQWWVHDYWTQANENGAAVRVAGTYSTFNEREIIGDALITARSFIQEMEL